jgi:hypothetical protein
VKKFLEEHSSYIERDRYFTLRKLRERESTISLNTQTRFANREIVNRHDIYIFLIEYTHNG